MFRDLAGSGALYAMNTLQRQFWAGRSSFRGPERSLVPWKTSSDNHQAFKRVSPVPSQPDKYPASETVDTGADETI